MYLYKFCVGLFVSLVVFSCKCFHWQTTVIYVTTSLFAKSFIRYRHLKNRKISIEEEKWRESVHAHHSSTTICCGKSEVKNPETKSSNSISCLITPWIPIPIPILNLISFWLLIFRVHSSYSWGAGQRTVTDYSDRSIQKLLHQSKRKLVRFILLPFTKKSRIFVHFQHLIESLGTFSFQFYHVIFVTLLF